MTSASQRASGRPDGNRPVAAPGRAPLADITVGIPVKDRIDELRQALSSVLDQTILPAEIVIVDDGSTVPITAEALGWVACGIALKIVRQVPNQGAARSYNRLVQEASRPYLAFLDSDDCFAPGYIEAVQRAWGLEPRAACVATGFHWCTEDLRPYRTQVAAPLVTRSDLVRHGNIVGGFSVLTVRRDMFLRLGGCPLTRGAFDWALLLRLASEGDIVTVQTPLLYYRSPSVSTLAGETKKYRRQILGQFDTRRMLPPAEAEAARGVVTRNVAFNLAQADRGKLARRCLRSYVARLGLDRSLLKPALVILLGGRRYASLLRRLALARAARRPA